MCKTFLSSAENTHLLLTDLVTGDYKIELTIASNAMKHAYHILKQIDDL